ncbi:hypothetical protein ASPZODRAFT_51278, partial [Penicilliopsis zonata CBS 506.65]
PRKRRKRTVASGAPEDCFSCSKRGDRCDRRRPYCSQCLDAGRECPGYKTKLTWDVGVASRGKLRGLSLPVMGARPAVTTAEDAQPSSEQASRSPAANTLEEEEPRGHGVVGPQTVDPVSQCPASYLPGHYTAGQVTNQWRERVDSEQSREEEAVQVYDHSFFPAHPPLFAPLLVSRSVGRTPRLQYLINYYCEVIAPVIFTFDGPTNPFRTYILHLAQESEALQEALATLSASNLKQRRIRQTVTHGKTLPARMSWMAHRALTDTEDDLASIPDSFRREELRHRSLAVTALNAQLADPTRRLSDSALAALLILWYYHACDTGVAQLQAHFAGVMKLLAIRLQRARAVSDEMKWFIRTFTFIDCVTATVNNRESPLWGLCLETAALCQGDWSLENLAGLDGTLFKLVAQLGRLNSLRRTCTSLYVPAATTTTTTTSALPIGHPQYVADPFWTEWHALRHQLESWRLPDGLFHSPRAAVTPQYVADLFNISESFRQAALVYMERLANPELPSAHPRIQTMVQIALRFLTAVQSDVYLLWPLFITGSECVSELDRAVIRRRCSGIENDSAFFNNLSCLELLERIW